MLSHENIILLTKKIYSIIIQTFIYSKTEQSLNVADITCALGIMLCSFKMSFVFTQAACCPLISGPVYSCYSSPCR